MDCKPETVMIHQVSKEKITVLSLLSSIDEIIDIKSYKYPIKWLDKRSIIPREKLELFKLALNDSLFILKAFRYGLIPEFLYFIRKFKPTNMVLKALSDSINLWSDGISVKCYRGSLHIIKRRAFSPIFRTLFYAFVLGSTIEELLAKEDLSLSSVKKMINSVRKAEVIKTIQDRELSKIHKSVGQFKHTCNEWIPLYRLLGKAPEPIEKEPL